MESLCRRDGRSAMRLRLCRGGNVGPQRAEIQSIVRSWRCRGCVRWPLRRPAMLRMEERDLPQPGHHEVRISVHSCGVCHNDSVRVEGLLPGIVYPRIPGHEVIGVIDALDRMSRVGRSARVSGRLVRRLLRLLPPLPSRRRFCLREHPCGHWRDAGRRLRAPYAIGAGARSGCDGCRGIGAAALRWPDYL
jgi:hypothetical protein